MSETQADMVGLETHGSSDIGVAISVAPHPRPKGERRHASMGSSRPVCLFSVQAELAQERRDSCPQRLLHNVQPSPGLCHNPTHRALSCQF